jgi:NAD(P)-dependent dehydrogenase (short-subunit alcohol dehydrogenase family)
MIALDPAIHRQFTPAADALHGRVILVTGAGSGIGRAAAQSAATLGAQVILAGRTVARLESVYDEIVAAGHPEPMLYPVDLEGATGEDYQQLAALIEEHYGKLDGLLLNAGILGTRTPFSHHRSDVWERVMKVNVTAQWLLAQALLPVLELAQAGSIVFTSSTVGHVAKPFWGVYGVSKFALEGLAASWAQELAEVSRVRINVINPGATRTDMRAQAYPAEDPTELATPADIMPSYLYLLCDASRAISGARLDAQG